MKKRNLFTSLLMFFVLLTGIAMILGSSSSEDDPDLKETTSTGYFIEFQDFDISTAIFDSEIDEGNINISWKVDFKTIAGSYFVDIYFSEDETIDDSDQDVINWICTGALTKCPEELNLMVHYDSDTGILSFDSNGDGTISQYDQKNRVREKGDLNLIARASVFNETMDYEYSSEYVIPITVNRN